MTTRNRSKNGAQPLPASAEFPSATAQLYAPAQSDIIDGDPALANLLHVEPRTIRLWRHRRGLPYLKLTARKILFRRGDVDAWLSEHRVCVVR